MALNDIYRVTLVQVWDSDAPISFNVFYYKEIVEDPTNNHSAALATQIDLNLDPVIRALQTNIVSTIAINVENIVPSADNTYLSYAPNTRQGSAAGEALPPYAAWAFRLNRNNSAVRNGAKRFWGVSEADQLAGVAVAGAVTRLNACAAALAQTWGVPGSTSLYQPRIFRAGRPVKTIPAKTIPAMLQADFDVASASYTQISTQNSRKFLSGA